MNVHIADRRRVNSVGDLKSGSVGLEIEEVQEDDAGLYFCTGRCAGAVCVNRGIHLVLDGKSHLCFDQSSAQSWH